MAFDFGAALTSAGSLSEAVQANRQRALEERKQQIALQGEQARTAYQKALTDREEMQKKQGVKVRSYSSPDGATHDVYLTPAGYQDFVTEPGANEKLKALVDARKAAGEPPMTPEETQNALTQFMGIKPPATPKAPPKGPAMRYEDAATVDKESDTGFSKVTYGYYPDPTTPGKFTKVEVGRVPTLPPWSMTSMQTEGQSTDPETGLTKTTKSVRTPIVGGHPISSAGATVAPSTPPAAVSPVGTPAARLGLPPLDASGHIPPQKGLTEIVRTAANQIIDNNGDSQRVEAKPGVKQLATSWAARYGVATNKLDPASRKVLLTIEPTLMQSEKLMKRIEDLKLTGNNTPFYLAKNRLMYGAGIASPEGELGSEISNLSLGSILEGTAALQGSSRAISALRLALEHTPQVWKDSPKLIYDKLKRINDRLNDVVKVAKSGGLAAGEDTLSTPSPQAGGDSAVDQFLLSVPGGASNGPK